jgi:hypothetical protein
MRPCFNFFDYNFGNKSKDAFKLIEGCARLFALYGWYLFRATKRRYL